MNKNLLILGLVWPEPKSSAAGSRMLQLIQLFKAMHYNITFASACAKTDNAFNLEQIEVVTKPIVLNNSSFDIFIKELNPEVVLFDRFMIEEQYGWRVAEQCPKALRLLDTEDLHCLRRGRYQALKDSAKFDSSYLYNDTAKREIASIYRCDLSLIISQVEMEILRKQFQVATCLVYYLPFLVDAITVASRNTLPNFKNRDHFTTIGNFLHKPNVDGLLHLKQNIWPLIRTKLPKAEIHIYGAYVTEQAKQLHDKSQGFLVKGYAENVNTLMQTYKICIVALRYGAGLKGKILDAMRNGLPCVSTSIGAEGMYGDLKPKACIEDQPIDFANKAIKMYKNEVLWNKAQALGIECLTNYFDKQLHTENFISTIENLQKALVNHRQNNFIGSMLRHHSLQSTKFMSKWIEEKNK